MKLRRYAVVWTDGDRAHRVSLHVTERGAWRASDRRNRHRDVRSGAWYYPCTRDEADAAEDPAHRITRWYSDNYGGL